MVGIKQFIELYKYKKNKKGKEMCIKNYKILFSF